LISLAKTFPKSTLPNVNAGAEEAEAAEEEDNKEEVSSSLISEEASNASVLLSRTHK